MGKRGPKPRPPIARFNEKLIAADGGCIEWRAGTNSCGYGIFYPGPPAGIGDKVYAHRWSYEYHVGPIPAGLHLDHLCRNTLCVNPDHLEPVSLAENVRRGVSSPAQNARKTYCQRGHALAGDNLYINPGTGYRKCRTCSRMGQQANAERRNAQARARRGAVPKTHCPAGHLYDAENTYIRPGTCHRKCRTCARVRDVERNEVRKANRRTARSNREAVS